MKDRIEKMGKSKKTAELLLAIQDTEGVKLLLKSLEGMIKMINGKLLDDERMSEVERDMLLRERACWEWLIYQFDSQNQILKRINKFTKTYE